MAEAASIDNTINDFDGRPSKGDTPITFLVTSLFWGKTEAPDYRLRRGIMVTDWQNQS